EKQCRLFCTRAFISRQEGETACQIWDKSIRCMAKPRQGSRRVPDEGRSDELRRPLRRCTQVAQGGMDRLRHATTLLAHRIRGGRLFRSCRLVEQALLRKTTVYRPGSIPDRAKRMGRPRRTLQPNRPQPTV